MRLRTGAWTIALGGSTEVHVTLKVPSGPALMACFQPTEVCEGHASYLIHTLTRMPRIWGLLWTSIPACREVRTHPPRRSRPTALAQQWKGNSSSIPRHKCKVHGSPLFPRCTRAFVERRHREVGNHYVVSRSGLHGPCCPSQIIGPWAPSAGRSLGTDSAGTSKPPAQPLKADSWNWVQ